MELIFDIIEVEHLKPGRIRLHGRVLKHLKVHQIVYLENNTNHAAEVLRITSYGQDLPEIAPMMGCSLELETNNTGSIFIKKLWQ